MAKNNRLASMLDQDDPILGINGEEKSNSENLQIPGAEQNIIEKKIIEPTPEPKLDNTIMAKIVPGQNLKVRQKKTKKKDVAASEEANNLEEYKTVKLQKELHSYTKKFVILNDQLGLNLQEFVEEAIREKIQKIERRGV